MAFSSLKTTVAPASAASSTKSRLSASKILQFFHLSGRAESDDPVCLGALDASTLRRFGYNEREIMGMKERHLR